MTGPAVHMLEEGYRGFLIRIPVPEAGTDAAPASLNASVTAVSSHAAAYIDAVDWRTVEGSQGDLHTLARIRRAIDAALDHVER